jgi:hypothetical protein
MSKEEKFFNALKDIFVGAKVEGESGYINLILNPTFLKVVQSILDTLQSTRMFMRRSIQMIRTLCSSGKPICSIMSKQTGFLKIWKFDYLLE